MLLDTLANQTSSNPSLLQKTYKRPKFIQNQAENPSGSVVDYHAKLLKASKGLSESVTVSPQAQQAFAVSADATTTPQAFFSGIFSGITTGGIPIELFDPSPEIGPIEESSDSSGFEIEADQSAAPEAFFSGIIDTIVEAVGTGVTTVVEAVGSAGETAVSTIQSAGEEIDSAIDDLLSAAGSAGGAVVEVTGEIDIPIIPGVVTVNLNEILETGEGIVTAAGTSIQLASLLGFIDSLKEDPIGTILRKLDSGDLSFPTDGSGVSNSSVKRSEDGTDPAIAKAFRDLVDKTGHLAPVLNGLLDLLGSPDAQVAQEEVFLADNDETPEALFVTNINQAVTVLGDPGQGRGVGSVILDAFLPNRNTLKKGELIAWGANVGVGVSAGVTLAAGKELGIYYTRDKVGTYKSDGFQVGFGTDVGIDLGKGLKFTSIFSKGEKGLEENTSINFSVALGLVEVELGILYPDTGLEGALLAGGLGSPTIEELFPSNPSNMNFGRVEGRIAIGATKSVIEFFQKNRGKEIGFTIAIGPNIGFGASVTGGVDETSAVGVTV